MAGKFSSTKYLTMLGLLAALTILLGITPLGFIQTPVIKATIMHVPVILGGVLLGPMAGGVLCGLMGLMSILSNTTAPTLTSFVFTPMLGNFWSIVVAMVPRICIGIVAAYVFRGLVKLWPKSDLPAFIGAGLLGSLTNTVLVMAGIYIFFGKRYAAAKGIDFSALFKMIIGVIAVSGTIEAAIATFLTLTVGKPLAKILKRS